MSNDHVTLKTVIKIAILKSNTILHYYCFTVCFGEIHAALVRFKDNKEYYQPQTFEKLCVYC